MKINPLSLLSVHIIYDISGRVTQQRLMSHLNNPLRREIKDVLEINGREVYLPRVKHTTVHLQRGIGARVTYLA